MSMELIGIIGVIALIAMICCRVWIGAALGIVGFLGVHDLLLDERRRAIGTCACPCF